MPRKRAFVRDVCPLQDSFFVDLFSLAIMSMEFPVDGKTFICRVFDVNFGGHLPITSCSHFRKVDLIFSATCSSFAIPGMTQSKKGQICNASILLRLPSPFSLSVSYINSAVWSKRSFLTFSSYCSHENSKLCIYVHVSYWSPSFRNLGCRKFWSAFILNGNRPHGDIVETTLSDVCYYSFVFRAYVLQSIIKK